MSTACDNEQAMMERSRHIANIPSEDNSDQSEPNVFRLAGMIISTRYPASGERLFDAATASFTQHPDQQVPSAEVVRRG